MLGHWTNRGWNTKSAAEVAVEATKAWKGAEHLVGVPADQVIRIPKDQKDEMGWKGVWQRLGAPAKPEDYDFSAIKFSDGTALDDTFVARVLAKAFALNLPKQAALEMAQDFTKYLDESGSAQSTEKKAKMLEQKAAMETKWGPNAAASNFVARRAAAS